MSDDCVSRQAAIDALTHKWDGMVTSVFDLIKELPSAEQEQRGRWIPHNENAPMFSPSYCSECGAICRNVLDKFCYQCGADMRGEQE